VQAVGVNAPFLRISTVDSDGAWSASRIEFEGGSWSMWGGRYGSIGIRCWINGYSANVNSGTDDWVVGNWYHYAMVGDGANGLKVYQNGVLKASHTTSLIGVGNISVIYCPENTYWASDAILQYAHFKMWRTNLTQSEIASEMRSGEPFKYEDILCWRPLLGPDTSDRLGLMGVYSDYNQKLDASSYGGSVPVAWNRQNALFSNL